MVIGKFDGSFFCVVLFCYIVVWVDFCICEIDDRYIVFYDDIIKEEVLIWMFYLFFFFLDLDFGILIKLEYEVVD